MEVDHPPIVREVRVRVHVPYSVNLVNNMDYAWKYRIPATTPAIAAVAEPGIICDQNEDVRRNEQERAQDAQERAQDAQCENDHNLALLSDEVPSSGGTREGRETTAFTEIDNILTNFITPYNVVGGHFDIIKCMIHTLFIGHQGFVGLTRAGPNQLSQYTATI